MKRTDRSHEELAMRINLTALTAAFLLGFAITSAPAFAQTTKVTIPFPFTVQGKTISAGVYDFEELSSDVIKITSATLPNESFEIPVIARLSAETDQDVPRVEFDKVGTTSVLSEIWLADRDGYLVSATKDAPGHQAVRAAKQG
jgi:hypothetical protein